MSITITTHSVRVIESAEFFIQFSFLNPNISSDVFDDRFYNFMQTKQELLQIKRTINHQSIKDYNSQQL